MSFFATQLVGFGAGGATAVEASYVSTGSDETDLTTYTFAGLSLGAEAPARRIVVVVFGRDGGATATLNSVSVAGVSATQIVNVRNNASNNMIVGIFSAEVPTGATGDVVATFSEGMLRASCAVYRVLNGNFTSIFHTASNTASGADVSTTINAAAGGIVIAGAATVAAAGTCAWTGVTENLDAVLTNVNYSSGLQSFTAAETGRTITADFSAPTEETALAVASIAVAP